MESRRNGLASSRMGTALVIAAIGALSVGCFERSLRPVNPCTRSRAGNDIRVQSVDEVDLLFMIDNSGSMAEEQAQIAAELPRLVRILASGDRDGDGMEDFQPVRSLHIGVISSDMGTGGFPTTTCDRGLGGYDFGDDGILLNRAASGCTGTYPTIFEFARGDDADAFAQNVSCVARTGTSGCGFEQQLEAVLKAVSPATPQDWTAPGYVAPVFHGSTYGHAGSDGRNAGFIRPNSALAIIMVTDEEDCSASIPEIFLQDSPTYGSVPLNLRCSQFAGEATHPIERYVRGADNNSGLIGLRSNPGLLIFAGIVGVPADTVADPSRIDYNAILTDDRMIERVDASGNQLEPSCVLAGVSEAYPPRRIVQVAQGIEAAGGSATIQSICQNSYAGALDAIIEKIADALGGACLPRPLNPDAEGNVQCEVFEILPTSGDFTSCDGLPGRESAGVEVIGGVERNKCRVIQVGLAGRGSADGWFYETYANASDGSTITDSCPADRPQRISFTGATSPVTNSNIRLECLQAVRAGDDSQVVIGSFCDPAADTCGGGRSPNATVPLACDAADRTCAVRCTTTADCVGAGLLGDVCDTRPWEDAVGGDSLDAAELERRLSALRDLGIDPEAAHGFCVNPTCI